VFFSYTTFWPNFKNFLTRTPGPPRITNTSRKKGGTGHRRMALVRVSENVCYVGKQ